jgi:hypothetical protein
MRRVRNEMGPVENGWHFNPNTFEHQLYAEGKIIYSVSDEACHFYKHSPQWLYGVARGIISPGSAEIEHT